MRHCGECRGDLRADVVETYEEDLLGVPVVLKNAVVRTVCEDCGDETYTIPDMKGLVAAVAMARCLLPVKLTGKEIKFLRKALGLSGRQFAVEMDNTPETLSRWENDANPMGGYAEKVLRQLVCGKLESLASAIDYKPSEIVGMKIAPVRADLEIPMLVLERVKFKDNESRIKESKWDTAELEAA